MSTTITHINRRHLNKVIECESGENCVANLIRHLYFMLRIWMHIILPPHLLYVLKFWYLIL